MHVYVRVSSSPTLIKRLWESGVPRGKQISQVSLYPAKALENVIIIKFDPSFFYYFQPPLNLDDRPFDLLDLFAAIVSYKFLPFR